MFKDESPVISQTDTPSGMIAKGFRFRCFPSKARRGLLCLGCSSPTDNPKDYNPRRARRLRSGKVDVTTCKDPREESTELETLMFDTNYPWKDTHGLDVLGEKPPRMLACMLETVTKHCFETNYWADGITNVLFRPLLPYSLPSMDLLEFRLLESTDFSNEGILEFFLEFGYKVKKRIVLRRTRKPLHCTILYHPSYPTLPKIVLSSLKIDEDLSEGVRGIIEGRMGHWILQVKKHGTTSLGFRTTPWDPPSSDELHLIYNESEFAAWCMIHGYTPSCIAMSLHKMRHPINQTMYSFESVDVDEVLDFLQKDNLLDPLYKNIFQRHTDAYLDVVVFPAELTHVTLGDEIEVCFPGSNLAFIDREIVVGKKGRKDNANSKICYDQRINKKLISTMYDCFEASAVHARKLLEIYNEVVARAKDGRIGMPSYVSDEDNRIFKHFKKLLRPT